jgi:hypothetical protein
LLAGNFENVGERERGFVFGIADQQGIIDAGEAGAALGAEPVRGGEGRGEGDWIFDF